jgi:LCP family protein required for cell wall assembly
MHEEPVMSDHPTPEQSKSPHASGPTETVVDDGAGAGGAGDGGCVGGGSGAVAAPRPAKRRNFFRRHLALTSLLVIFLLLVGCAGGFVWYLNDQLGNIQTFPSGITQDPNHPGDVSDSNRPLNILVLGSDDGNNVQTVADDLKDGTWTRGAHRSDTIILVHLPADRQSAQIISIPRDSWVPVPTFPGDIGGDAKINAAFSWGGPALAVRTIQDFTGLHIDHVAMIDWNGFKGLTDALGGVRVYIPQTFTDDSQHITWHQGWQTLDGVTALEYVRTRHGLANGDFDRIERQQNFLRTIMNSMLSTSTFLNPLKLAKVVGTVSSFVQVDDTWSTSDIRNLAISSKDLRANNVQFTTAPFGSYDTVAGQSIVRLDAAKCKVLFRAFDHGSLTQYLQNNPGSALPGSQSVK